MADYERISELKLMIAEETVPDRIEFLRNKLEKVQSYVPEAVKNKIRDLMSCGLMDNNGNLIGINSMGRIGPELRKTNVAVF
jgi:hypothetical protein